jgi:hypothetical protein
MSANDVFLGNRLEDDGNALAAADARRSDAELGTTSSEITTMTEGSDSIEPT